MPKITDNLQIVYVELDDLVEWRRNPRAHSVEQVDLLVKSFREFGFKEPIRWEPSLNGGEGGIVAGNGRLEALFRMREAGEAEPRGVLQDWKIPVVCGVESESEIEAERYGLAANSLAVVGEQIERAAPGATVLIYDPEKLEDLLQDVGDLPPGVTESDLSALDDFLAVDEESQDQEGMNQAENENQDPTLDLVVRLPAMAGGQWELRMGAEEWAHLDEVIREFGQINGNLDGVIGYILDHDHSKMEV